MCSYDPDESHRANANKLYRTLEHKTKTYSYDEYVLKIVGVFWYSARRLIESLWASIKVITITE